MATQDSEPLLKLWVDNDREQYSPEAFEAARLVLSERKVAIPPQNPPVPHARPAAAIEIADSFWLGWLRPFLIVGFVVGALGVIRGSGSFQYLFGANGAIALANSMGRSWMTPAILGQSVAYTGLPILLIVGAWRAMRLAANSRTLLLVYAWGSLGLVVYEVGITVYMSYWPRRVDAFVVQGYYEIVRVEPFIGRAIFPLILVLLLRRPEIKRLFHPSQRGFEPETAIKDSRPLY